MRVVNSESSHASERGPNADSVRSRRKAQNRTLIVAHDANGERPSRRKVKFGESEEYFANGIDPTEAFASDADRGKHLGGDIARSLTANADALLAEPPKIDKAVRSNSHPLAKLCLRAGGARASPASCWYGRSKSARITLSEKF